MKRVQILDTDVAEKHVEKIIAFNQEHKLPVAHDPIMKKVLEMGARVAKTQATILITGETGVGKELFARYVHAHSLVAKGPFISMNCASLPENMVEAILFGYEKGAFTGSVSQYIGKFEQAHNGTLLLDEISEMPLTLQAKLLRVLQEREVERLGGKKIIPIKVRVIAATNSDLQDLVNAGAFRSDLFYRLNVVPIHCPPLRKRKLDIAPLAHYLFHKHAMELQREIPLIDPSAIEKLENYDWPGNVREMDNVIQRTLVLHVGDVVKADDILLPESMSSLAAISTAIDEDFVQFESKLKATEAQIIIDVLNESEGRREAAAKKLNISPRTLRYKISKLKSMGIKIP